MYLRPENAACPLVLTLRLGSPLRIIVTHDIADFDALASAVAAQKLHPGSTIVLAKRLSRGVRDFLALHKDRFLFARATDIDQAAVTHVVVVDVRRKSRLRDFPLLLERVAQRDETLDVSVYDHHGASDDDLPVAHAVVEPVGSATTLLVEVIRERGIDVDPVEATLFALGIHTDTGSLTFAATSARDARALAWLIDRGASQRVLVRYLTTPFSEPQRRALASILDAVETEAVGALSVAFAVVALESAVDGLDVVVSEALALGEHPALFALFHVGGRRVQVIGRARSAWIDVGKSLAALGGGGHAPAGAASIKDVEPAVVRERLLATLREAPPRPRRVADLMSSPVRTVSVETTLQELGETLQLWRHTGVPVVRDGAIVGIVSHRDVERAARDGRLHLPVSSCMTHAVETTTESTLLEAALERMVARDVGRLPVLRDGKLVGIVTRSDVLAHLYE